jgi:hypothetical protein
VRPEDVARPGRGAPERRLTAAIPSARDRRRACADRPERTPGGSGSAGRIRTWGPLPNQAFSEAFQPPEPWPTSASIICCLFIFSTSGIPR